VKLVVLAFITALPAFSQTAPQTNQNESAAQHVEGVRAACIQGRRVVCGKILKVLPDGLIVDSGYTNLMRVPLNRSWLIPGTAVAARAENLVERNEPDAVCIGPVFLVDIPKSRDAKPKIYDYVVMEAFPVGQYTYTSVGDVHRTVRKFTTKLASAVKSKLDEDERTKPPPK
jgi:hypothetical protein